MTHYKNFYQDLLFSKQTIEIIMNYWLIKTEPHTWSWQQQNDLKVTSWDGVRNYQASNNMKKMAIGDLCFFYHSGDERRIMGIVKVIRTYYPDHTDTSEKFGMVDVEHVSSLSKPVTLSQIKQEEKLHHLALVKQSRLSVMPIDQDSWNLILAMSK